MNIPRCKGTRDLLPEDMVKFRYIEDVFRQSCKQWGYEEVRTPVIEYLHLFTSAGTLTPEMLNRVYSFLDWDGWSGERVVLRPDGTIPIARLFGEIAQQQETKKLSYVENVFAFEGTGKDSREQWECGVELLGRTGVDGDVELITFAVEILKKLGISPEVRLSHAGLMKALINELGSQTLLEQVLNGKYEVMDTLKKKNPELGNQLATLFSLSGTSKGFLENLRAIFPSLAPNFDELIKVTELLDALNCPFVVHLTSGMSFEYYTGTIFQFYHSEEKIGGGGRYDELIPLVGDGPVPASGFALYVDRIMNLLKYKNQETKFHRSILIQRSTGSIIELKSCYRIAELLRSRGYIVEIELGERNLNAFRWILMAMDEEFHIRDQMVGAMLMSLTAEEVLERMKEV